MKNYFTSLLTILLVAALFSSCSQPTGAKYWMDNPTDDEISVYIDETEYNIPANSGQYIEIEYGMHTLKYGGQSINVFVKPSADKKVIINPTQSSYINYSQLYVVDGTDEETFDKFYEGFIRVNGDSIDFKIEDDTVRMFAPMKVYNDLFIEHTVNSWEFGLDAEFPSAATIFTDTGEHYQTSKKKVFREKDFWEFFRDGAYKDSGMEIVIDKPAYKDLPRFNPVPENMAKIQGEKYRKFLQDYIDTYYVWFESTGSDAFKGAKKFDVISEDSEFNTLKLEYREVYPNDPSFTDGCYEYFNLQVTINYRFNFLILD